MSVCLRVDEKENVDNDILYKNVTKPAEPVDDAKNKASWDCHNRPRSIAWKCVKKGLKIIFCHL